MRLADGAPAHPFNLDVIGQRVAALAPDGLAFARGQGGEEILEGGISLVEEMELLVGAGKETVFRKHSIVGVHAEVDVDRRCAGLLRKRLEACCKCLAGGRLHADRGRPAGGGPVPA